MLHPKFNGGLAEPPLKLGHARMNDYIPFMRMQLLIYAVDNITMTS